jgi:hypothetical protein
VTRERALEIIAAHGADVGRWPAAEATGVLALAARDAAVAVAIADARRLDDVLAAWASPVPERRFDAAALIAAVPGAAVPATVAMPARVSRGWLAGGALAAAVAAVLLLMPGARHAVLPSAAPPAQLAAVPVAPRGLAGAAGETPVVMADATAVTTIRPGTRSGAKSASLARAMPANDADVFQSVFTPTIDEDELI